MGCGNSSETHPDIHQSITLPQNDDVCDEKKGKRRRIFEQPKFLTTEDTFWAEKRRLVPDYEALKTMDVYATNAPEFLKENIKTLVNFLVQPAKSDVERVRVLFCWIVEHVTYDFEYLKSANVSKVELTPDNIIAKGKTVSQGYAMLFEHMCRLAGIDCETISGVTKGLNYTPGHVFQKDKYGLPDISNDPTAHAWNKVRLEGEWYLCDCTRPDLEASESSKKRHITTESPWENHFLADPDSFLSTHFPLDDGISLVYEQFVENPVSDIRRWTNEMSRYSGFFAFNMTVLTPDKSVIEADDRNHAVIQLRAPHPMKYNCKLTDLKSKKNYGEKHTMVYTFYDEVTAEIFLPKSGEYLFTLYAVPKYADDQLSSSRYCIVKCKIIGRSPTKNDDVISSNIWGVTLEFAMLGYRVPGYEETPVIVTESGEMTITVELPKAFIASNMRYYLSHGNSKNTDITEAKYVYAERKRDRVIFHFSLPETGDYSFSISVKPEEKDWFYGAGFLLRCQSACSAGLYPDGDRRVWGPTEDFDGMGLEIIGNFSSTLETTDGLCELKVKSTSDVDFRYSLVDGSGSKQNATEMVLLDF